MDQTPLDSSGHARATKRSHETFLVSYTISPDIPSEYTETYDIAVGGMAMLTNAALAPNSEITIELELRDDTRPNLRLHGNVRWSTYDPLIMKYRTGVAFTERTPEFERDLLRYIDMVHQVRTFGAH